jgi:hypothetical protein
MEYIPERTYTGVNESLTRLAELVCHGQINLNPPYQRGDVWSREKQQRLIQSLFENYYIPPIILRKLSAVSFECLDGKQRLQALTGFLEGKFSVKLRDDDSDDAAPVFFYDLEEDERSSFGLKALTTIYYMNLTDADTIEVFNRVNNGVSLSNVERWTGLNPTLLTYLREVFDATHIKILPRDNRFKELNYYLRAYILEVKGEPVRLSKDCVDKFVTQHECTDTEIRSRFLVRTTAYMKFLSDHVHRPTPVSVGALLVGYWLYYNSFVRHAALARYLSECRIKSNFGPSVLKQAMKCIE